MMSYQNVKILPLIGNSFIKTGNLLTGFLLIFRPELLSMYVPVLIRSGRPSQRDRVSIVQFDDKASTIIGLRPERFTGLIRTAFNGCFVGQGRQSCCTRLSVFV